MKKVLVTFVLAALAAGSLRYSVVAQGSAPVASVTVAGTSVSVTWTAVPGATSYRVDVGTFPGGSNVVSASVGNTLAAGGSLSVGSYYLRVIPIAGATVGTGSNEVTFNVGTPRPGVPVGFTAAVIGSDVVFTWSAPVAGGAASAYVLQAGTPFNLSNLATVNVGNVLTYSVPNVVGLLPPGTYFARLVAVNGTGAGDASDEAVFTLGNFPGVPTPNDPVIDGNAVTLSWNPPAGGLPVTSYRIEGQHNDFRALGPAATVDSNTTSYTATGLPNGSFYWRVRAFNGATPGGVFGTASYFVGVPPAIPAGPRTPNPRTGRKLPKPTYGAGVVQAMARAYPAELRNSCRETGGNNTWLFRVVRELRRIDTRWGLNWKRGGVGDLSQDIVAYNWGSLPDEGTLDAYIWDIIGGHCGNNPDWFWDEKTDITLSSGTIMKWTLQPYVAAGYQP